MEEILIQIVIVLVLGIAAQWLAWLWKLPSILLLLTFGFLSGPIFHLIDPDEMLGHLVLPFVSASVAIILFEGGLSLKFAELKKVAKMVRNLLSIGVLVTWLLSAFGVHYFLKLDISLSLLIGAILVVTGPTVIIPILRYIRLSGKVGPILKWEGMMIDPIGVILTILVFEAVFSGEMHGGALGPAVFGFFARIIVGCLLGLGFGYIFIFLLKRFWIPDFLDSAMALMFAMASFGLANHFFSEAGLVAVTVMGIMMGNQKQVSIRPIIEFKENLGVLVISTLFVILAARLKLEYLFPIKPGIIMFFVFLVFVVRPLSVFISGIGTDLKFKEKLFLSSVAPRGIVAAATAALFSLSLEEIGYPHAQEILPVIFLVIMGSVALYGLCAAPMSYLLGVARPNPQGVIILGASHWVQVVALMLKEIGVKVLLVDTNQHNVKIARKIGLPAVSGNVLSEDFMERLDLNGIGYFFGMTPNDEVNALGAIHFEKILDSKSVYQLPTDKEAELSVESSHFFGRKLFPEHLSNRFIEDAMLVDGFFKSETLGTGGGSSEVETEYGNRAHLLFAWTQEKQLKIITQVANFEPKAGDTLIYFVSHPSSEKH